MRCAYHESIDAAWRDPDVVAGLTGRPCFDQRPFAVVDLETTSADPSTAEVLEVGIVLLDAYGQLEGTYTQMCDPGDWFPENVHRLRPRDVRGYPPFADVADEVHHLIDGRVFVAHEVAFDLAVTQRHLARAGTAFAPRTALCTRENLPCLNVTARSLVDVCAELDLAHPTPHRALPDAVATTALLQRYLERARYEGHLLMLPHGTCS